MGISDNSITANLIIKREDCNLKSADFNFKIEMRRISRNGGVNRNPNRKMAHLGVLKIKPKMLIHGDPDPVPYRYHLDTVI
eukprot:SAG31_NODE_23216_length_508_cov_7.144254_2_plen_81_part_00